MPNKFFKTAVCFCALLIFCEGCFPYHYSFGPGVQGTVVDRQTHLPLSNASVNLAIIYGYWDATNNVDVWKTNNVTVARVNASGFFEIRPVRKWGIYIVPMDVFPRRFEVSIKQTNYEPVKIYFLHSPMATGKNAITKLGCVQLNPKIAN